MEGKCTGTTGCKHQKQKARSTSSASSDIEIVIDSCAEIHFMCNIPVLGTFFCWFADSSVNDAK